MAIDIITKINLDMKSPNAEIVYASQYDSTGHVNAQLLNDGEKWEVPTGAVGLVQYQKSDRIGGYYDTTDLGEAAVSVSSDRSIISIALDGQLMTTSGNVYVQVSFYKDNRRLSTFNFLFQVQKSAIVQSNVSSKWFVNLLRLGGITVDDTLSIAGNPADAKATGDKLALLNNNINNEISRATNSENLKVNKPIDSPNGLIGQLLATNGDGTTTWTTQGTPTDAQVGTAVTNWLDDHPEATTTVEDNSITKNKLIESLRNSINNMETKPLHLDHYTDTFASINSVLGDYSSLRSEISPQGIAYNSSTDRYAICFARGFKNGIIVEVDSSWRFVRGKDYNDQMNLGHFNDITYNENTNKYYVATSLVDPYANILAIDADTLEISDTINIGDEYDVSQISYDNINDKFIIYSNHDIYSISSDFETVIKLFNDFYSAVNITGDYEDSDIQYLQGSCMYHGRFVSLFWILKEHSYAISRLVFLNEKNDSIDFIYDYNNENYNDECEGLYFRDNSIYSYSYAVDVITVTKIQFNKYLGQTDGNQILLVIRYHDTLCPNSLEEAHDNAHNTSMYVYWVNFAVAHPVLGGNNGFLFGQRNTAEYGTQVFISQERFCKRIKYNGEWGDWYSIVDSTSTSVTLSLKNAPASIVKQGSICHIISQHDFTSLPAGVTLLGTIPVNFRPRTESRFSISNKVGELLNNGYYVIIETNGNISLYWGGSEITAPQNGAFSGTYQI